MDFLSIKNLSVSYKNWLALEDISLTVQSGDFVCVAGCNGSGKTSLLKGVLGLVKSKGEVQFFVPRDKVAYMPQINAMEISFPALVKEVVQTGTQSNKLAPFYTQEQKQRVTQICTDLGIEHLLFKQFCALSGGQRQRVLLARMLASQPQLLLLDEPFSAMDAQSTLFAYQLLDKLCKNGCAVLMVSHELLHIKDYANRFALLDKNLLFCGNAHEWEHFKGTQQTCAHLG